MTERSTSTQKEMMRQRGDGGGKAVPSRDGEHHGGAAMDDPETTPTVDDGEGEGEVLLAEDDSKDPDKKGIARSCNLCRQSHTACETYKPPLHTHLILYDL
jgi:hypothetical protein